MLALGSDNVGRHSHFGWSILVADSWVQEISLSLSLRFPSHCHVGILLLWKGLLRLWWPTRILTLLRAHPLIQWILGHILGTHIWLTICRITCFPCWASAPANSGIRPQIDLGTGTQRLEHLELLVLWTLRGIQWLRFVCVLACRLHVLLGRVDWYLFSIRNFSTRRCSRLGDPEYRWIHCRIHILLSTFVGMSWQDGSRIQLSWPGARSPTSRCWANLLRAGVRHSDRHEPTAGFCNTPGLRGWLVWALTLCADDLEIFWLMHFFLTTWLIPRLCQT